MSGATIASIASVASIASTAVGIGSTIFGGGGGGGSGGVSGGGGGIDPKFQKFYSTDAANPLQGVHVGTTPLAGEKPPSASVLRPSEAIKTRVASPRDTMTQSVGNNFAAKEYQNIWADRLSKYLDYNTRALG